MKVLEYLVPSRARRDLLRSLQSRRQGLSVRQLARQSGLAYSNAHRELEQMERAGLLRRRLTGRALGCSWNGASAGAQALRLLLKDARSSKTGSPDEEALFWNLKRWGAPLIKAGRVGEKLDARDGSDFMSRKMNWGILPQAADVVE